MFELLSLINDMSNIFAELDNNFQILEKLFPYFVLFII